MHVCYLYHCTCPVILLIQVLYTTFTIVYSYSQMFFEQAAYNIHEMDVDIVAFSLRPLKS